MSINSKYLQLLTNRSIDLTSKGEDLESYSSDDLKGFYTCDPVYLRDFDRAVNVVKEHFRKTPKRPLNSLILGGPGSGKSYLAKQIYKFCDEGTGYKEFNLSQFTSPREIIVLFDKVSQIVNGKDGEGKLVVLLDEFDVKIGGGSAVQYLISPIYDRYDLRNVAFIFSGSYLKNRELLGVGVNNTQRFDFFQFLFDFRVHLKSEYSQYAAELEKYIDLISKLEQRTSDDPDRNVLAYLQSLEKLLDFQSRINGFTIEIPAIDSPLDVTKERFQLITRENEPLFPTEVTPAKIIDFIEASEGKKRYGLEFNRPWDVFAIYQDSILRERLNRVGISMKKRFEKYYRIEIQRGVLNYLVVAPLFHGMRSLEFLVSLLIEPSESNAKIFWPGEKTFDEQLSMHIRDYREFYDWRTIWDELLRVNDIEDKYPASSWLILDLKTEDEK